MRLVINKCYGGFSLSPEACLWLWEHGFDEPGFATDVDEYWKDPRDQRDPDGVLGRNTRLKEWREWLAGAKERDERGRPPHFLDVYTPDERFILDCRPSNRAHPLLVACVEALGSKMASGSCAELRVVEIPDGVEWEIDEHDGLERVAEVHRTWG